MAWFLPTVALVVGPPSCGGVAGRRFGSRARPPPPAGGPAATCPLCGGQVGKSPEARRK